jgi:glyoxylase-like metal-dependent hydrolase (beta-lactamase superfamily II)
MTAPRITRVPILPLGMVNAHLILGAGGCVLVDSGVPGSEARVARALAAQRRSFKDIKLIVITHAHIDHAGNAARLRELSGAPIVAHADDARYFRQEAPMTFCPTGWFARLFLKTGFITSPYARFEPDILLAAGETLDLERYGISGLVRHTPGHTAGSISVELASRDALVGDLIASGILLGGLLRTGHAKRPPFEDDPRAVGLELGRLLDSGHERFHMGHGGPLPAGEVQRHARMLLALETPQPAVS